MARTNLTITDVARSTSGVAQPTQDTMDVANGNQLAYNDGRVIVEVNNSGASTYTFTVQTPGVVDGLAITDLVLSVAAGATRLLGPFPPNVYNQSDGTVAIDPQNVALKCRAYHLT